MTVHSIRIEGVERTFDCAEDQPILDAALAEGISLPHNCRGGACGTCKGSIVSGEVGEGWVKSFALTDEERASGKVLVCVARPMSDCVIRLDAPLPSGVAIPPQSVEATVTLVECVSRGVVRLVLTPDAPFRHRPGMHVELAVPGVETHRTYSIASEPDEPTIELFIALRDGGQVSAWLAGARAGERVGLHGPYGTFTAPGLGDYGRLVLVAGGTGIAPVLSLLRGLVRDQDGRPTTVLFSVRTAEDLFAWAELETLQTQHPDLVLRLCLTGEGDAPGAFRGRATALLPEAIEVSWNTAVLVAGSAGLGEAVREAALACGVGPDAIQVDAFTPTAG
jgi:phenol hydroxylase P5 protein